MSAASSTLARAGLVIALAACASPLAGCKSLEKAAAEDPLKCERDPKCEKKRGRQNDCSMQCADDPACVERCEQVQKSTLGR
ncbi:MAG: hypothetical protein KC657_14630 [Myxococcales bacterium]|nr:hypothetical protein [Myxococcales bacterium]